MIVKIHEVNDGSGRKMVSVCDDDLLGKKFEEKGLVLDLTSNFYKGEQKTEEKAAEIIKCAHTANFVGKKSVDLGIKIGIINKKKVIKVKGVLHAQALL